MRKITAKTKHHQSKAIYNKTTPLFSIAPTNNKLNFERPKNNYRKVTTYKTGSKLKYS